MWRKQKKKFYEIKVAKQQHITIWQDSAGKSMIHGFVLGVKKFYLLKERERVNVAHMKNHMSGELVQIWNSKIMKQRSE